jgi:anaerobic ribonucleoside-triphosphate reductase activating protein
MPSGDLLVGGMVPLSTADFPGQLAAVLFCQGCPWRCGYCHNPHLQAFRAGDAQPFAALVPWLKTRRGLLDAVVFSGGEPLAQAALGEAVTTCRKLGFEVGLHTAGTRPRRLAAVLPSLAWVGLDFKGPPAAYARFVGRLGVEGDQALACLDLLLASGVALEVRTTVHPLLHSPEDLDAMASVLVQRGVKHWVLQQFRATGCANQPLSAHPVTSLSLEEAVAALKRPGLQVLIRS